MKKALSIHFTGIGGSGMSGLAEVFHLRGYRVQGSDIKKTAVTRRLEEKGICIKEGHSPENIRGADYLVYSSCIRDDNPELKEARLRDIPVLRRIEALNMLIEGKDLIAVSGMHGKTTTSSLISFLLIEAGLDPTVFIGGDVDFLNGNARCGKGDLVVSEADESDGSFLLLNPLYSVSTNIDAEHMDYYSDMDDVVRSYRAFIGNTRTNGRALVCIDDHNLRDIARDSASRVLGYGFSRDADISAKDVELLGVDGSRFNLLLNGRTLGSIRLSIPGAHNILNSLAAIGLSMELGVGFSSIKKAIGEFGGVNRRFNLTRLDPDILLIDDYAHHPTEIKATLKILEGSNRRVVAVFQPHRYSRTRYLKDEFGSSFGLVDHLVITDIYSAHEEALGDTSAMDICRSAERNGHKDVYFVAKDDIIKHLAGVIRPGDAVFVLGAGDIDELPGKIINALRKEKGCDAKA